MQLFFPPFSFYYVDKQKLFLFKMATEIPTESFHQHSHIGLKSEPVVLEDKHLENIKIGTARPRGILAIHLKQCKLKTAVLETDVFHKRSPHAPPPNPNMYFKIQVGDDIKQTSVIPNMLGKHQHALDELKHFSLKIDTNRRDLSNRILISLVCFEGKQIQRIIAKVELHLYDIVKNLFVAETYGLKRRDKAIGTIDAEFCFAYGRFGYGYSSQLENTQKIPADQIRHSMFYRPKPPTDRCMDDIDVLTCVPIGHPSYINFTQKAEIGNIGLDIQSEQTLRKCFAYEEPVLLMSKIRKGMTKLQRKYCEFDSRQSRLKFLNDLVSHKHSNDMHETVVVPKDKSENGTGARPKTVLINVDDYDAKGRGLDKDTSSAGDDHDEDRMSDLDEVRNVVQLAPGITSRPTNIRSSEYARLKISEQEENDRLERLRAIESAKVEEGTSSSAEEVEIKAPEKVSKLLWIIDAFKPKKRISPSPTESNDPENAAPAVNPFMERLRSKRAAAALAADSTSTDEAIVKSTLLAPPKLLLNPATPEQSGSESDVSNDE
ncbi:unnamed protein product [Owenia fusiformis]|uniref:Cation channel sperm-associated targeting subunit tau C2 domain-containing protein n=1 Tax=Owenia fusiformis TaxID=6347 RepID=A0A8S4QDN3_OWEFU|nr:unnamed protein product [Owenia fusiformis]